MHSFNNLRVITTIISIIFIISFVLPIAALIYSTLILSDILRTFDE